MEKKILSFEEIEDRNNLFKFFSQRKKLFFRLIIIHCSIPEEVIDANISKIDWNYLSASINMNWNANLIEKYKDKLGWNNITRNEQIFWSKELIEKFKDYLNWQLLSESKKINWSIELIDYFIDRWNWQSLSNNKFIYWTAEIIDYYKDKLNWNNLSNNPVIPLSIEIIKKYQEKWNWNILPKNPSFPWTEEVLEIFYEKIKFSSISLAKINWTLDLFEKYKENINFNTLSLNENFCWTEDFIEEHKNKFDWKILSGNQGLPWSDKFIEKYLARWNWDSLSKNEKVNWSINFIRRYEDNWNWELLTKNKSLPWSIELIYAFKDNWNYDDLFFYEWFEWSEEIIENYSEFINWTALSLNNNINWTEEFITHNEKYLIFPYLHRNENIPWSIKFIEKYENKFSWAFLPLEENLWKKLFKHLDAQLIIKIVSSESEIEFTTKAVSIIELLGRAINPNLKRDKPDFETQKEYNKSNASSIIKEPHNLTESVILSRIVSKNDIKVNISDYEKIPERLFQNKKENLFWAIYINGNKVVINKGKIGEFGEQKKYHFLSFEEAKIFYETEIKMQGNNFYEIEGDIDPALKSIKEKLNIIGGLTPWKPIIKDKDGDVKASKFCGKPALLKNEEWPFCQNCNVPMLLFVQLSLKELPKDFDYNIGQGIFQYFNCPDFYCGKTILRIVEYPDFEINHNIEVPETEYGFFQPKLIIGWEKMKTEYSDITEQFKTLGIDLTKEELDALNKYSEELNTESPSSGDKLGGYGTSYYEEETECSICQKKMRLIFQIESEENIPYSYSDAGTAYIYQCPEHKKELLFSYESG